MNKIFAIIFVIVFALSLDLNAQTVTVKHGDSGPYFTVKLTRDTASVEESNFFDASAILGQTCYLADSMYSIVADSVDIVVVGRQSVGGITYYTYIDTVANIRSGVTAINTLSLSGIAPDIAFRTLARSGSVSRVCDLWLTLMSPTTNYLRERKRYGNLP